MDDYAALVERVCFTLPKVMGCVLLSDDGLVLSAYPEGGNGVAETAWLHFCAIDEPVRGFLVFSDQVWAYVRHGSYAAFVVAEAGVRAGVLVDQLEQVLATISIGSPIRSMEAPEQAPSTRTASVPPAPIRIAEAPASAPGALAFALAEVAESATVRPEQEPESEPEPPSVKGSREPVQAVDGAEDDDSEIDRVQLAQEFSGLLQMDRADDEASS